MRTSRDSWLTKPEGDAKISEGVFGYLTARVRQRAYDIVIREFKKSGITQAQLARRWGKDPAIVSRFLARPGNWEIDTYTEALFAISGAVPALNAEHPIKHTQLQPKQTTTSTISKLSTNDDVQFLVRTMTASGARWAA
jgi:hypothetical protein